MLLEDRMEQAQLFSHLDCLRIFISKELTKVTCRKGLFCPDKAQKHFLVCISSWCMIPLYKLRHSSQIRKEQDS